MSRKRGRWIEPDGSKYICLNSKTPKIRDQRFPPNSFWWYESLRLRLSSAAVQPDPECTQRVRPSKTYCISNMCQNKQKLFCVHRRAGHTATDDSCPRFRPDQVEQSMLWLTEKKTNKQRIRSTQFSRPTRPEEYKVENRKPFKKKPSIYRKVNNQNKHGKHANSKQFLSSHILSFSRSVI